MPWPAATSSTRSGAAASTSTRSTTARAGIRMSGAMARAKRTQTGCSGVTVPAPASTGAPAAHRLGHVGEGFAELGRVEELGRGGNAAPAIADRGTSAESAVSA